MSEDAALWMENHLRIRLKSGQVVPLKLNKHQRRLIDLIDRQWRAGLPVRVVALKTRQVGITTAVQGWFCYRQAVGEELRALTVAHSWRAASALRAGYDRFLEDSGALRFGMGNVAQFETAATEEPGIMNGSVDLLHATEVAFWPYKRTLPALLQAVPDRGGTVVVLESSGNGYDESFYQSWRLAEAGISGYIPFFIPWWDVDEYRVPVDKPLDLSAEEEGLMRRFRLTPEQFAWRRWVIASRFAGREELFRREYPATPEEAFISTCE